MGRLAWATFVVPMVPFMVPPTSFDAMSKGATPGVLLVPSAASKPRDGRSSTEEN
jgi:hypothetical protein